MGTSTTPTYIVRHHYCNPQGSLKIMECVSWKGKPSSNKLENQRVSMNQSLNVSGTNFHISKDLGYIPHIHKTELIRNDGSGSVVLTVTAPMFEVF